MPVTCNKCKEETLDLITVWMAAFDDMSDLDLPFKIDEISNSKFNTLTVCKHCLGDWMCAIRDWFHAKKSGEV